MDVFHGNLPFGWKKRPKIQDINHIIMGQFALKTSGTKENQI